MLEPTMMQSPNPPLINDSHFPLTRYRFQFSVQTPLHLPAFAGSALRGAFGHALKRVSCMAREKDCKTCPLYRSCPYPQIFEPPPPEQHSLQQFSHIPSPYIIEPPAWGEHSYQPGEPLIFDMVLLGRSLQQLPLIVLAWQKAFARGIGPGNGRAELAHIELADQQRIYQAPEQTQLPVHPQKLPLPQWSATRHVTLHITTPLRLQHNGKPLGPERIQATELLMALVRRISLLSEFHASRPIHADFSQLKQQAAKIHQHPQLHWQDWTRYSNRQQQKMSLGGVVGYWQLQGELNPFIPFLYLGQWLHIGKNASFGLGKYQLQAVE